MNTRLIARAFNPHISNYNVSACHDFYYLLPHHVVMRCKYTTIIFVNANLFSIIFSFCI